MGEAQWPQRALMLLSDGDKHSRYTQRELMRMALEGDVHIYTIVHDSGPAESIHTAPYRPSFFTKTWDPAKQHYGAEMLKKLSGQTGGLHFHVTPMAKQKRP